MTKANQVTPPISNGTATGAYVPLELAPFDARAGAMDAFELPSLVNGQRVPRKAPSAVCVGAAGPVPSHAGQQRFAK